jgi:hypothetical protein
VRAILAQRGMACVRLAAVSLLAAPCALAAGADDRASTQAEIQIALCSEPHQVVRLLSLTPRGSPRDTWLFDDAALSLFERGVRLRLRVADGGGELTLKAAVDDCAKVSPALLAAKTAKCEHDVHGDLMTAAVSLSARLNPARVQSLLSGRMPLADALDAAQSRYLKEALKLWPLPADLRRLGPIQVLSYRARDNPYDVDISRLPAGESYIEISRKVPLADAPVARRTFDDDLLHTGLTVCTDQSAQAINKLRALLRAP